MKDFEPSGGVWWDMESARKASLRRECRGLVTDGERVVARPLHRFFSVSQVRDTAMPVLGQQQVVEVTRKLDGVMAFGVVVQGKVQLWTKGGYTKEAQVITRWAAEQGALSAEQGALFADCIGLVAAVEAIGCTAVFEWTGRQARIKVKEGEQRLVLLQVRDKVTGKYMGYKERAEMAVQHGVGCVAQVPDLEGKTFFQVYRAFQEQQQEGEEVMVVRLRGGAMVKVKCST